MVAEGKEMKELNIGDRVDLGIQSNMTILGKKSLVSGLNGQYAVIRIEIDGVGTVYEVAKHDGTLIVVGSYDHDLDNTTPLYVLRFIDDKWEVTYVLKNIVRISKCRDNHDEYIERIIDIDYIYGGSVVSTKIFDGVIDIREEFIAIPHMSYDAERSHIKEFEDGKTYICSVGKCSHTAIGSVIIEHPRGDFSGEGIERALCEDHNAENELRLIDLDNMGRCGKCGNEFPNRLLRKVCVDPDFEGEVNDVSDGGVVKACDDCLEYDRDWYLNRH